MYSINNKQVRAKCKDVCTPTHTAHNTMGVLRNKFRSLMITIIGEVPWQPRSPDVSLHDFFIWGYLETKVLLNIQTSPRNLHSEKRGCKHLPLLTMLK